MKLGLGHALIVARLPTFLGNGAITCAAPRPASGYRPMLTTMCMVAINISLPYPLQSHWAAPHAPARAAPPPRGSPSRRHREECSAVEHRMVMAPPHSILGQVAEGSVRACPGAHSWG